MTKQEAIEEREQAVKRGGESYANGYMEGILDGIKRTESKTPIDINKLRDEFFDECVDKRAFCEIGESFDRVVSLAPHDMFEWFKKKLTTKL